MNKKRKKKQLSHFQKLYYSFVYQNAVFFFFEEFEMSKTQFWKNPIFSPKYKKLFSKNFDNRNLHFERNKYDNRKIRTRSENNWFSVEILTADLNSSFFEISTRKSNEHIWSTESIFWFLPIDDLRSWSHRHMQDRHKKKEEKNNNITLVYSTLIHTHIFSTTFRFSHAHREAEK